MRDLTYRGANRLGLVGLRALDARVRVSGAEHLPTTGPVMLAGNHVSYLDFLLVEYAARRRGRLVRFLCRSDVWDVHPALSGVMDVMGHVPVDRTVPAHAWLRARSLLRAGEVVGAFPEAGLSPSQQVRDLMPGPASLAAATGAPLVPVVVWGTQRLAGVDHVRVQRGRLVDVVVGPPLTVAPGESADVVTQRLGAALQATLDDVQRRPEHAPRDGEHAWWHPRHLGGHAHDAVSGSRRNPAPPTARTPGWRPRGT